MLKSISIHKKDNKGIGKFDLLHHVLLLGAQSQHRDLIAYFVTKIFMFSKSKYTKINLQQK